MSDDVTVELVAEGHGVSRHARVVMFDRVTVSSALGLFDYVASSLSNRLMQGIRKKYRLALYRRYPNGSKVYTTGFLRDYGMERLEERCTETWANLVRWVYREREEARWARCT